MAKMINVPHPDEPSLFAGDVMRSFQFVCAVCGEPILSASDTVISEPAEDLEPAAFDFVHASCDASGSGTRSISIGTFLSRLRELGTFTPEN